MTGDPQIWFDSVRKAVKSEEEGLAIMRDESCMATMRLTIDAVVNRKRADGARLTQVNSLPPQLVVNATPDGVFAEYTHFVEILTTALLDDPPSESDTHALHSRLRRALALIESEPDTVGLYSAACELRAVLSMHARGVTGTPAPLSNEAEYASLTKAQRDVYDEVSRQFPGARPKRPHGVAPCPPMRDEEEIRADERERIAREWDGCMAPMFDPAGNASDPLDIGATIRGIGDKP